MSSDTVAAPGSATTAAGPDRARRLGAATSRLPRPDWATLTLALICYVPLLFTHPGKIGADTKAYLYLDPSRLLARAPYMWDPHVGMGTVTHQNIGYLLPMGPWYWTLSHLGLPMWVAERLWTGTLLFAAGTGIMYLLRTFGWGRRATFVAGLAYALSPYVLEYEARISAILMPWAGLGWLLGTVVRGLRVVADEADPPGRLAKWRHPALFALIVALIGAVNATSLIYVLIAPILWLPFAIWGWHEVRLRAVLGFAARTILLTVLANLWWVSGLYTQAGWGLDVLAYTETVKTVASASQASEVLRGLGNWYFYGRDGIAAWVEPADAYTGSLWLMAISFAIPTLALLSAACLRWGYRAYFVLLIFIGTAISVGVYPFTDPSPLGGLFKAFAASSSAGLALRSMPRAVPLVALGLSVFLAGGVDVLSRSVARRLAVRPRWRTTARYVPAAAFGVVVIMIAVNMAPLWKGQFVDKNLDRSETLPSYMTQSAAYMDGKGDSTRVLELPGSDFSHYRWGATLDPVPPGIMDRPFVSRELIPYGEPASAELLRALDRRLQEGVFELGSLPSLAGLMSVGDVELRSDLQYERFRTPRPKDTWQIFGEGTPQGLAPAKQFGPKVAETPQVPMTDEVALAETGNEADPPAVAVFGVNGAVPIVRAEAAKSPLVVAGDGEGLVDAAAAGQLANSGVVLYSASMTPSQLKQALGSGADLLVTDSNRKRAERWGTIRENYGYTETANEKPLRKDVTDARLPIFPDQTTASQTVAEQRGVKSVEATDYGNPVSYAPADRPSHALDGDPTTAWRVGAFSDVRGEKLRVDLNAPVTTDHLSLTQPLTGPRNRWITQVSLSFDGGKPMTVSLDDSSRRTGGQRISFPTRKFSQVEITIKDTNLGVQAQYNGASGVGFAEVGIPGIRLDEVLALPTALLTQAGASSLQHRLVVQLTRDRANPAEPFKEDTEKFLARDLQLPTARRFSLTGTARLSADASDALLDATVGRRGGVTATSSARLPGDVSARAAAAFDGDPSTIWMPPIETPQSWVQVSSPTAVTTDSLTMSVVTDGRHSVPANVALSVDGKPAQTLSLPPLKDSKTANATHKVRLTFPTVTGHTFRISMGELRPEYTRDYFSHGPDLLPVGIADVGLAGLQVAQEPTTLPGACRSDLITIDGKPVSVKVTGTTQAAESRSALTVSLCGSPVSLSSGSHVIRTAKGAGTGLDVDRLELASAAGGSALTAVNGATATGAPATAATSTATRTADQPKVSVVKSGETSYKLHVSGASTASPFWLVLGESLSDGWKAKVSGGPSLGTPRLVDGYANGWLVKPTSSAFDMTLDWAPQHTVWKALGISVLALLGCLALVMWPGVRRWRPGTAVAASTPTAAHPLTADAGRLDVRRGIVAVAVITAGTALVIRPVVAPIVLVLSLIGLLLPRGRALLRLGSAACLGASAVYVLQVQARYHLPSNGQWVAAFHKVATLSWLAVALLVADVILGWARRSEPLAPAGGSGWAPGDGAGSGDGAGGGPATGTSAASAPGPVAGMAPDPATASAPAGPDAEA